MATVVKTFSFLLDAEGLVETGGDPDIFFAHEPLDGTPLGCVKFTDTVSNTSGTEIARQAADAQTWETWGVPPGATVNQVRIIDYRYRPAATTRQGGSNSFVMLVRRNDGVTAVGGVTLATGLMASAPSALWETRSGTNTANVEAAAQPSNTPVRFEIDATLSVGTGGGPNLDHRFDEIRLEITYTLAVMSGGAATTGTGQTSTVAKSISVSSADTTGTTQTVGASVARIIASADRSGTTGTCTAKRGVEASEVSTTGTTGTASTLVELLGTGTSTTGTTDSSIVERAPVLSSGTDNTGTAGTSSVGTPSILTAGAGHTGAIGTCVALRAVATAGRADGGTTGFSTALRGAVQRGCPVEPASPRGCATAPASTRGCEPEPASPRRC